MPRNREIERINRRARRYAHKLEKEYWRAIASIEAKAQERTASPWAKPDSNNIWSGSFAPKVKTSGF